MRISKIFKVLGIVIVSLVLIVAIGINSSFVQNKIIGLATDALSKQLKTDVKIEHVYVNLLAQRVSVEGVRLQDQNRRELLHVKEIWANFCILPLLKGQVALKEARISGVKVLLSKPKEGPANYQFLLDATKKDKKKKKKKTKSKAFDFDLQHGKVENIQVRYNDQDYILDKAVYSFWRDKRHVDITGLHFKTDNHKLRKNTNKPHRGYFDAGHLDCVADLGVDITRIDKDTVSGLITDCTITDTITGFYIKDVSAGVTYANKQISLSDISLNQLSTHISIPVASIRLPDKKQKKDLHFRADSIYRRTYLKDISRPFAPVLKNFTIPLNVKTSLDGNPRSITLRAIHVNTDDNLLVINSTGILRNLKGREFKLHFLVHDMVAKPGIKDKILLQFAGKKHMMYQIYALGVVKYHGSFDIAWRNEQFRGLLNTEKGDVDFEFQIDDNNKYLNGRVSSDSLLLGDLFKLKDIKDVSASASFTVDISKPRTAEIRKQKGGKLPIGKVHADVRRIKYKSIYMKNIVADIESDGATAEGDVAIMGNLTDLMLQFTVTDTEDMQNMKVKPRLRFRKMVGDK